MRWCPREGAASGPSAGRGDQPGRVLGSAARQGTAGTQRPGCSPGQGCRLRSCRCSVSWAWHGAPAGPSLQLLQADQGPRAGRSWGRHTRDPLTQVLWQRCAERAQTLESHGEQSLCSPARPITLTWPEPPTQSSPCPCLAAGRQPHQLLQSCHPPRPEPAPMKHWDWGGHSGKKTWAHGAHPVPAGQGDSSSLGERSGRTSRVGAGAGARDGSLC